MTGSDAAAMSDRPDREIDGKLGHYVDKGKFDPYATEKLTAEQERYYMATQWRLMWWKLKRHKLAVAAGIILLLNYGTILFSEMIAPYNQHHRNTDYLYAPPQVVHMFHKGHFVGPFVYGYDVKLNMDVLRWEYTENPTKIEKLRFFCRGDSYKYMGLVGMDFHFVCPAKDGTFFLLGTDRLGRDMLSRITMGARISMTVGLVGITISFILGITIGGLAAITAAGWTVWRSG